MIRDALVRLVLRNWLILGLEKDKGYYGNFGDFGILESSGTQLRKLEIFYSNIGLAGPGVEFWEFWLPGLGTRGALWLRHVVAALGFVCACVSELGRWHVALVGPWQLSQSNLLLHSLVK